MFSTRSVKLDKDLLAKIRRLAELARVEGLDAATGDYRLTPLPKPQPGDLP